MAYLRTHFSKGGTEEGGFAGAPEERVAEVAHLEMA